MDANRRINISFCSCIIAFLGTEASFLFQFIKVGKSLCKIRRSITW